MPQSVDFIVLVPGIVKIDFEESMFTRVVAIERAAAYFDDLQKSFQFSTLRRTGHLEDC